MSLNVPSQLPKVKGPYAISTARIMKVGGKEGDYQLTNFTASIVNEVRFHDGNQIQTWFDIDGRQDDGTKEGKALKQISIKATDFPSMSWVNEHWGAGPVIFPTGNATADVRTCIQLNSTPKERDIYTHTGWTVIGPNQVYLSTSGGIGPNGLDPTITVQLPNELARYTLPAPEHSIEAVSASIALSNIGPKMITWPLLLACYRAAIGPADFAMHLAGRTGTFKSEFSSLIQSHYGAKMDARHLPASWNATANALEALAYKAKNAIFCVDDFVPVGTTYQVRQLQSKADQFIRGQGNQAGRARMTDTIQMGTTFFPRGIVLSTGEDIPEGHSVRGRMLIMELSPGDIPADRLSTAQKNRHLLPLAMSQWIKWLSTFDSEATLQDIAAGFRDANLGVGHTRTPSIIGDLLATLQMFESFLAEMGAFTADLRNQMMGVATQAVLDLAANQDGYLNDADPVTSFIATLQNMFSTGVVHAKTRTGGIPQHAERWGWQQHQIHGETATYKSVGPRIGWVDHSAGEFLMDPNTISLIKKHSSGKLQVTQQTLLKRLKEANLLTRVDAGRDRNTVRITAEGHPQNVMAMDLAQIMPDN
jgi:Domain of unknown function (DUF927)